MLGGKPFRQPPPAGGGVMSKATRKKGMPRASDERGFGFRKEGLLRILTAADLEQVLLAVEELGFRLPDRKPIETLAELIIETHKESEALIDIFLKTVFNTIGALPLDPSDAQLQRQLAQLRARRRAFVLDLKRKRDLIEKNLKFTGESLFQI